METRALGQTGLRVPVLCLGTMTFGLQTDEKTSYEIMDRAFEHGIDFFDTADVYPVGGSLDTVGQTEEIIGRWLRERGCRDRVLLATKCRGAMGPGANDQGLSRHHILRAVEGSLRRLGTDTIDLYQTHFFDPHTPIEETARALDDLVRSGKVRYLGCSNYPAWRLGQALATTDRLGLARYESVQPRYNLLYREIETELVPLCESERLGMLVYNPLAGGMLSGKYRNRQEPEEGTRFTLGTAARMYRSRYWQDAQLEEVEALRDRFESEGLDLGTASIAWTLAKPGVTSAIIGASRPGQLEATIAAADFALEEKLVEILDEVWWRLPRRPVLQGYR